MVESSPIKPVMVDNAQWLINYCYENEWLMVDSSPIKPYEISSLWILVGIGYNYVVKTNKTPPMTGNGNHTTHKKCDFWDGLWHCLPTLNL